MQSTKVLKTMMTGDGYRLYLLRFEPMIGLMWVSGALTDDGLRVKTATIDWSMRGDENGPFVSDEFDGVHPR